MPGSSLAENFVYLLQSEQVNCFYSKSANSNVEKVVGIFEEKNITRYIQRVPK